MQGMNDNEITWNKYIKFPAVKSRVYLPEQSFNFFFFPFRTKIIEICSTRKQSYRGVKSNLSVHIHTKIQVQATINKGLIE